MVDAGDLAISYVELAARVEATGDELGAGRRLVAIEMGNDSGSLIAYLAALQRGHVVLLHEPRPAGGSVGMLDGYRPDTRVTTAPDGTTRIDVAHGATIHDLHPDLALLLSTSGSTGSPKLVRLSHENLANNAEAIATYLSISPDDRAITSLPLHYCYGLSVANSYLIRGAGLIISDLSVVDQCFWTLFEQHGVTSFAGVPYTFELLERSGFADMSLPTLRYLTQAGGRMPPERVARFAELSGRQGWKLFVMYGQTEATARMAYVPPELLAQNPTVIGVPIPGGRFELGPVPDSDDAPVVNEGELIYHGPNVMLGYATEPADLALGRTIEALHTGDIGRVRADGLYEIIGRKSRFLKLFGKRIDLGQVESALAAQGLDAACTGDDERLVIAVVTGTQPPSSSAAGIAAGAAHQFGIPSASVAVVQVQEMPRLSTGKLDYAAIKAQVAPAVAGTNGQPRWFSGRTRTIRSTFESIFGADEVGDDATFVSLGGDSMSYVEVSVALEEVVGHAPTNWHTMTISQLEALDRHRSSWSRTETNVVLRAAAIVMVVGNHFGAFRLPGGAASLFMIAGYNFSRFQLRAAERANSGSPILATMLRIAIPTWLVIIVTGKATVEQLLLVHQYAIDTDRLVGGYWFIEALVQVLAIAAVVMYIRPLRSLILRRPMESGWFFLGLCVTARYGWVAIDGRMALSATTMHEIAWLFALGWIIQQSNTVRAKVLVTLAAFIGLAGRWEPAGIHEIELLFALTLIWVKEIPIPRPFNHVLGITASASLYIYLTHWHLTDWLDLYDHAWIDLALGLAAGVACWYVGDRLMRWGETALRHRLRGRQHSP